MQSREDEVVREVAKELRAPNETSAALTRELPSRGERGEARCEAEAIAHLGRQP